ncbi:MAG: lysophospholipid acyltransferase family protein [Actinomycetes bacterium]
MTRRELRPLSGPARAVYRTLRAAGVLVARGYWRLHVEGIDRLPSAGPFIVAPVHRSYVDFFIVALAFPRCLRFMVKNSIWRSKGFGSFVEWMGSFPVDRDHPDRNALRACEQAVRMGDPVVMFPEGQRRDGDLVHDLFDGPAWVACRYRVPVVPVGIGGSERAMPRGARFVFPARIRVVVGEPIYPDVTTVGRVPRRKVADMTSRVRAEVQRLYDQARAA